MRTWPDVGALFDIVDSARRILAYVEGLSEEDFRFNLLVQDAVIRRFLIIGEATKQLSAEIRAAHPEIPWGDIVGMRNRLIHVYFEVDLDRVRDTVAADLPPLIAALDAILD